MVLFERREVSLSRSNSASLEHLVQHQVLYQADYQQVFQIEAITESEQVDHRGTVVDFVAASLKFQPLSTCEDFPNPVETCNDSSQNHEVDQVRGDAARYTVPNPSFKFCEMSRQDRP